jgi:hypothetical protein
MFKDKTTKDGIAIEKKQLKGQYHQKVGDSHDTNSATCSVLMMLRQQLGNRITQRFLVWPSGNDAFELNDTMENYIKREYGRGQPLDRNVQKRTSVIMGVDFGGVRVHTSQEADTLNRKLNAKAFTIGRDIFFSQGAYDPHSRSGSELIAHELTHVVQQSEGRVSADSSGKLTVRPADDEFEREADAAAKAVTSPTAEAQVQRQIDDEEEEIQTSPLQRQALDEEENIQTQAAEEEEELPE